MFAVLVLKSTGNHYFIVDKRVFWSVFTYIKAGVVSFGGSLLFLWGAGGRLLHVLSVFC